MCGLTGFLGVPADAGALAARGLAMAQALQHRGPDDHGVWVDADAGLCLAHRRLAIVDQTPAGHQPMISIDQRFVLAFNGEIYNHADIRQRLQDDGLAPSAWRGTSDTETLLTAIQHWGLVDTLVRTVGMFAIALWDQQKRMLYLARDRFGEKPLYYGWLSGAGCVSFAFGSELKAMRAHPGFANRINRDALALYLRYLYVPAPYSIYQGIFKLEPGCILSIGLPLPAVPAQPPRPPSSHGNLTISRWWSMAASRAAAMAKPITDEQTATDLLDLALRRAVAQQSLADVPLGAFLSGGVDSSTIVALMQTQSSRPVKTFTVGFVEHKFDESPNAALVASHLGTDHNTLVVTGAEALATVNHLPAIYDEPFADSSQIATYLISSACRRQVTVALTGDAGDELFGGYTRYIWGPNIWRKVSAIPSPVRSLIAAGVGAVSERAWDSVGHFFQGRQPDTDGLNQIGEKVHKLAYSMLDARDAIGFYRRLLSTCQVPSSLLSADVLEPKTRLDDDFSEIGLVNFADKMMYLDSISYLPDDILCKVDRASMAVGLETRVPFLDHRVAEIAWRMPLPMKIQGGRGKLPLRRILSRHVPFKLVDRPKSGFSVPIGDWLLGPLKTWAENLLSPALIEQDGFFSATKVHKMWQAHLSGYPTSIATLWAVLMFQSWLHSGEDR